MTAKKSKKTAKKNTVKSRNAKIARDNAKFAKLSRAQKRVAIAQDVLAALDAKKLVAESGVFANLDLSLVKDYNDELQTVLNKQKTCNVCALGGLFVSAVKKFDKLRVCDLSDLNIDGSSIDDKKFLNQVDVFQYLGVFFSQDQLHLIESCFELNDGACVTDEAMTFWESTPDLAEDSNWEPETRMRLIMQNIIRNKGKFNVNDRPVVTYGFK